MKLRTLVEKLDLKVLCCGDKLDQEVTGGYASDLLSNVIAYSKQGDVWITIQAHANIVAVAVLKELAAIIIAQERVPDEATVNKATEEKVPLLLTPASTFEVAGKLYQLGIGPIG